MVSRRPRFAMRRWLPILPDLLFPPHCEACEAPLPLGHRSCLCAGCRAAMGAPPAPLCRSCGVPLGASCPTDACPGCAHHPPAFTAARAAPLYLPSTSCLNPLVTPIRGLTNRRLPPLAGPMRLLLPVPLP